MNHGNILEPHIAAWGPLIQMLKYPVLHIQKEKTLYLKKIKPRLILSTLLSPKIRNSYRHSSLSRSQ